MGKAHSYDHLVSFALTSPWALRPEIVAVIVDTLSRRLAGEEHVDLVALRREQSPPPTAAGVAVIPLHGVIAPRMNLFSEISGGTTFEQATRDLHEAVASKDVGTIVLDWDSPGGNVFGCTEFAREVLKARATKPVISQVNFQMCSAAYWCGACATEIVASPSAVVGSIGVYSIHEDLSEALKARGIKRTYIAAGKHKVDGNSAEPLSDDARAHWKANVDTAYSQFIADVAKGRGVSEASLRAGYGEGRAVLADEAKQLGMVDRIASLSDTLDRVLSGASASPLRAGGAAAELPSKEPSEATDVHAAVRAFRRDMERQLLALTL